MASYAVYAFCRHLDSVVDTAAVGTSRDEALSRIRAEKDRLESVYSGSSLLDGGLPALQDAVLTFDIPMQYFFDLFRGVEMDLTKARYATFAELHEYCYCVASTVGLIMLRILGASDKRAYRHAADLGTAMQLTNILRDVAEDRDLGRRYLPAEDMDRFGYTDHDLVRGTVNDEFVNLMRFEIARARAYYASAEGGVPLLTNDGSRLCVRLMSGTYARILDAIEAQGYDVFTRRAYVSFAGKLAIGWQSLLLHGRQVHRGVVPVTDGPEEVRESGSPVHTGVT